MCVRTCVRTDACLHVHVSVNERAWVWDGEGEVSCELANAVINQLNGKRQIQVRLDWMKEVWLADKTRKQAGPVMSPALVVKHITEVMQLQ